MEIESPTDSCSLPSQPCQASQRSVIYRRARTCKQKAANQCKKLLDAKKAEKFCIATRKAISRFTKPRLCSYIVTNPAYEFENRIMKKDFAATPQAIVEDVMNGLFTPLNLRNSTRLGGFIPDYARMLYLLKYLTGTTTLFHVPGNLNDSMMTWTNENPETEEFDKTPSLYVPAEFYTFFNSRVAARKGTDYIFVMLRMKVQYTETSKHANFLMFDMRRRLIERYEPSGFTLYSVFDMDDLDDTLRSLGKELGGFRYKEPYESCPRQMLGKIAGIQRIAKGIQKQNTDPGGHCKVWSLFMLEQKFRNPGVDIVGLHDRAVKYFRDNAIDMTDFARKYTARVTQVADDLLARHGYTGGDKVEYIDAHWISLSKLAAGGRGQ